MWHTEAGGDSAKPRPSPFQPSFLTSFLTHSTFFQSRSSSHPHPPQTRLSVPTPSDSSPENLSVTMADSGEF